MNLPTITWRDIVAWLAIAALIALMYGYGSVREKARGEVWHDTITIKTDNHE